MANYKKCALFHLVFAVFVVGSLGGNDHNLAPPNRAPSELQGTAIFARARVIRRCPAWGASNIFDSIPGHAAKIRNALNNTNGVSQEDVRALIDIFVGRSPCHSSFINNAYNKLVGGNMLTDLRAKLNPKVADFIITSMKYANDYYSEKLRQAMSKNPTDEDMIINVFSTFKDPKAVPVARAYKQLYKETLKSKLENHTTGDFRNLLVAIADAPFSNYVDDSQAIADAEELYNTATQERENFTFLINTIFSSRFDAQLRQTFLVYRRISLNDSITEVIRRQNFSASTEKLLLAIVERVESEYDFYAKRLHQSVVGEVNDAALNLFFVCQEKELRRDSLKAFEHLYGKSFESFIAEDPSNDYYYALRSLVTKSLRS